MNKPNAICLPDGGLKRCVSLPSLPVQKHRITSMKSSCWCALTPSLDSDYLEMNVVVFHS